MGRSECSVPDLEADIVSCHAIQLCGDCIAQRLFVGIAAADSFPAPAGRCRRRIAGSAFRRKRSRMHGVRRAHSINVMRAPPRAASRRFGVDRRVGGRHMSCHGFWLCSHNQELFQALMQSMEVSDCTRQFLSILKTIYIPVTWCVRDDGPDFWGVDTRKPGELYFLSATIF